VQPGPLHGAHAAGASRPARRFPAALQGFEITPPKTSSSPKIRHEVDRRWDETGALLWDRTDAEGKLVEATSPALKTD
jgi:hypothetical protein